jgi:hypothetical protein
MNLLVRHSLAAGTGLALAICGAAIGWGQSETTPTTTTATPTQTAPNQTQAPAPTQTTDSSQTAQPQKTLQMVQAQAQLDNTLDAKKAKQGEPVTAKLEENVQIPNAQELPKNTVLEGHVDQVTPSDHKSDSTLVMTFDKVKLKDGQELPIKATVIAISEPAMAAEGGAMPAQGAMPSSGGGGGAPMGGSVPSGAGAMSGGSSPRMQNSTSPSMNQVQAANGSGEQGQNSGVPDVKLTSSIHEHTSATLTSKGRNVHVPDGTQIELAIGVIPAGVRLQ